MDIQMAHIITIVVIAWLCYYANARLNSVPVLREVIQVLIILVAVLMVLQSTGLTGAHVRID